ncbi:MAG TPA: FecR family protein, partial [Terriglobales bacterium]|nr:FecR family protein [Terriglobales bacterium]
MIKKHWFRSFTLSVVASLLACSSLAAAQAKPAPTGPKAGNISALLPTAKITRGTGQNKTVTTANKGDDVVWNDLIQTEKGGRARILLNDQSVISLGSQAELRIIKHDNRSQQTAMQLTYGRVRLQVSTITRDAGRFELRTPTAVAGVIGTEFGTDSSLPGVTDFICISGMVTVANEDSKVGGSVQCPAGSTTTVNKGLPPTAPKPATQQQIRQLIQDTEPAVISSFSPASAILGTEVISAVTGSKMLGINAVTI